MTPIVLMTSVIIYGITKFIIIFWISQLSLQDKLFYKYQKKYPLPILITFTINQLCVVITIISGLVLIINFLTK